MTAVHDVRNVFAEYQPSTNGFNGARPGSGKDRDAKGRFAAGNKGGPGNPFARKVAALRTALIDALNSEAMQAIARSLIKQATQGDVAAAKLLLEYTVGRPAAPVDPDRVDLDALEIARSQPHPREMIALAQRVDAASVVEVAQHGRPATEEEYKERLREFSRSQGGDGTRVEAQWGELLDAGF